jgi:hypothetical protein
MIAFGVVTMKPLTVLATGPSATADEFEPLRAAGLEVVIGRPLDAPRRRPWSEADLIEAVRAADIVLASHLELISRPVTADPYVDPARAAEIGVTLVDLPTLLAESDVVSLHPSLTDETRRMIGEKELRRMKPTAVLINTARGDITDEDAVARAVEQRWIAGAALDAFTKEPLPADGPLRRVDPERIILTPHNVAHSEAGRVANLRRALDQIQARARGDIPAHVINPDAIPGWRARRG